MDPVTHTLMGGSLAATGLRRTTALATPTLLIAANLPDVDVAALAGGPYTGLALRRGLTHGLAAMVVLPLLLTGVMVVWRRWIRRSSDPGGPPLRPGVLLGLAYLGTWTHPILDWLNTYGMRWLLPFDGRWSYGDAVFIVDPWLWLLLGGPVFLTWSHSRPALAAWAGFAGLLSLLMILVDAVPVWARLLWFSGLATWGLLRFRPGRSSPPVLARACLLLAVGYVGSMVVQTAAAEAVVAREARDQGVGPIQDIMVGPAPVHPLRRQVIVQTESAFWTGTFHWARSPRVDWESPPRTRRPSGPAEEAARRHPEARAFLTWSRFPHVHVEALEEGWHVEIRDVRYDRQGAGGLRGLVVRVDREGRPVEAGPIPAPSDTFQLLRPPLAPTDSLLFVATFDTAWTRIRDTYYDSGMGGLDWDAARSELRPLAAEAASAGELRNVLVRLLDRLGESHFVLIPATASEAMSEAAPLETAGGGGWSGLQLRWVDGEALVFQVADGSPAALAGIRPGDVLLEVDGDEPGAVVEALEAEALGPGRGQTRFLASVALNRMVTGPEGARLRLRLESSEGTVFRGELQLVQPPGELVQFGTLPPFRLEVEDRELSTSGGVRVGLIRLNGWFPAAAPHLTRAVDRFREADGMILDLRGNPGGLGGLVMGVGGHFLDEPLELGALRTRETTLRFVVNPQRVGPDGRRVEPYQGPLAILVDELSASTSEIFAAGLQALGRAHVLGAPTAGQALPAVVTRLPNGDRLMHVVADFTSPDGSRIEGRGVEPDELVPLSRSALARGDDPVIQRALAWITTLVEQPESPDP